METQEFAPLVAVGRKEVEVKITASFLTANEGVTKGCVFGGARDKKEINKNFVVVLKGVKQEFCNTDRSRESDARRL